MTTTGRGMMTRTEKVDDPGHGQRERSQSTGTRVAQNMLHMPSVYHTWQADGDGGDNEECACAVLV